MLDPFQVDTSLQAAGLHLPSNTQVIKVNEIAKEVEELYGGLALSTCTSGFSVIDSSGIKGITTAGHCSNTQYYGGVQLPFVAGTIGSDYDIQWHRGDQSFNVTNKIYDGNSDRFILGEESRAQQTVGFFVCKYGMTTGYECGEIAQIYVNGVNVRVDNITVAEGDSGGPWFLGNTAYGTTIYSCVLSDGTPCAIYGPVDQIYDILGLKILPVRIYLPLVISDNQ